VVRYCLGVTRPRATPRLAMTAGAARLALRLALLWSAVLPLSMWAVGARLFVLVAGAAASSMLAVLESRCVLADATLDLHLVACSDPASPRNSSASDGRLSPTPMPTGEQTDDASKRSVETCPDEASAEDKSVRARVCTSPAEVVDRARRRTIMTITVDTGAEGGASLVLRRGDFTSTMKPSEHRIVPILARPRTFAIFQTEAAEAADGAVEPVIFSFKHEARVSSFRAMLGAAEIPLQDHTELSGKLAARARLLEREVTVEKARREASLRELAALQAQAALGHAGGEGRGTRGKTGLVCAPVSWQAMRDRHAEMEQRRRAEARDREDSHEWPAQSSIHSGARTAAHAPAFLRAPPGTRPAERCCR
jgi:hypothetical protein